MISRLSVNLGLIATLVPFIYIAYFISNVALGVNGVSDFDFLFKVHMLMALYTLVLMAFYIVYLVKLESISTELKLIWVVVLFVTNLLAMPVIWYLYIYKKV